MKVLAYLGNEDTQTRYRREWAIGWVFFIAWPGITQAVTSRKVKAANPIYSSQLGPKGTRLAARNSIVTDILSREAGKHSLCFLKYLFNRFYFAAGDSLRDTRPASR